MSLDKKDYSSTEDTRTILVPQTPPPSLVEQENICPPLADLAPQPLDLYLPPPCISNPSAVHLHQYYLVQHETASHAVSQGKISPPGTLTGKWRTFRLGLLND